MSIIQTFQRALKCPEPNNYRGPLLNGGLMAPQRDSQFWNVKLVKLERLDEFHWTHQSSRSAKLQQLRTLTFSQPNLPLANSPIRFIEFNRFY